MHQNKTISNRLKTDAVDKRLHFKIVKTKKNKS